ncbi:small integral membrane protein 27 [Rana temporaria]|uniref:small integral membrane protein 27 n=1 Tax=Rana temporaria TaxID=8407 RepID=UPI001AADAF16|nr:small integral membrane protein 27 [Rana temporaria]
MMILSRRAQGRLLSLVLFCIVIISWGFVLYAARLSALWQLQAKYPKQILS